MATTGSAAGGPVSAAATPWVLRDYAFVGDGERGAVLGPRGEVVWLCAPRWDSDAVLSALIGGPGQYVLCPEDEWNVWGGYYEEGTLVHVSRWVTGDAVIECRNALALPADPDRLVLLRRIRAVRGHARVRLALDLRPGFGSRPMAGKRLPDGSWSAHGGGLHARFLGAPNARTDPGGGLRLSFTVPEGAEHDLLLELGTREPAGTPGPARLWQETERAWARAVPDCSALAAPRDVRHAYAVLHGLTSAAGGGMVAATTTSLPERADSGRNYDYRYAWIRDQCYAGIAVAAHGPHPLLDRAVRFVTARILADGDALRPAYTVDGGRIAAERSLPLPGYPGGSDLIGNHAAGQFQLDTYGEALQLFAAAARHGRLEDDARRAAELAADSIGEHWQRPDAGVWELEERWWTHSRLAAVAGLRALARTRPGPAARRWTELADTILTTARRRCTRPDGVWTRAADDPGADAALLLPLARGCLPDGDPSAARTRRFVAEQLADDGYLYRFRHGDRPLGEAEGAFLLCGFVMSLAARREGEAATAARWFERTRAACGTPGLFAEEYDVRQRQLRGNLPQAFVHALLVESAVALTGSPPDGRPRAPAAGT